MNHWAKIATESDIACANLICERKQAAKMAATIIWWRCREIIILPYLDDDRNVTTIILDMTSAMKEWLGPLG